MAEDSAIKTEIVPADVLQYWRAKGYKPRFSYLDVLSEEESIGFGAAKLLRKDILTILKEELDRSIAEGIPFDQFKKNVKPRFEELGFWHNEVGVQDPETGKLAVIDPPSRLRTIYNVNLRTARAQGQYERQARTQKTRPYLLWVLGAAEKHRPEHVALEGLCLPVEDPFWQTAYPPCLWNCHCSTRSVSKREYETLLDEGFRIQGEPILDDEGNLTGFQEPKYKRIQTTAPDAPPKEYVNHRTGVTTILPEYTHPSFADNPATRRKRAIEEALGEPLP